MKRIKIFISGSEKNAPKGFASWRDEVKNLCVWRDDKLQILDPVTHFNYHDKPPVTSRQCVNYFMWLIDKCDVFLVNLDHSHVSVGTGCEVQHACDKNKPIIGFGTQSETWYEWTHERCEVIFNTMEEAIDYIVEHYCNV